MKLNRIAALLLLAVSCHQRQEATKSQAPPTPPAIEWKAMTLGTTGVTVDLPEVGVKSSTDGDFVELHARTGDPAIAFSAIGRRHALRPGSAARRLYGDDAHNGMIDSIYGGRRADGSTVTETFRGAFGDDRDARGGRVEGGGVAERYLYFANGYDFIMLVAATKSEGFAAAEPTMDRFFKSARVEFSKEAYE